MKCLLKYMALFAVGLSALLNGSLSGAVEAGSDVEITRQIRQDLLAHKGLSSAAHNVRIITVDGEVTVEGPVPSQSEKDAVLNCARSVFGVTKVISKVEVPQSTF